MLGKSKDFWTTLAVDRVALGRDLVIQSIRRFVADERGATAIEYGLIAALVSVAIIVVLTNLGGSLNTTFTTIKDKLDTAGAAPTG